VQSDPRLHDALQSSPQLAQLLSADGISRLLDAVQSSDAEAALQGIVGGGPAGDLSQQRKLLIQLQSYAAQLKMTMPQAQQQGAHQQQLMMRLQQRMDKMSGAGATAWATACATAAP
jgi:uncharacterized protein HemX